jgi:hypothetical protein
MMGSRIVTAVTAVAIYQKDLKDQRCGPELEIAASAVTRASVSFCKDEAWSAVFVAVVGTAVEGAVDVVELVVIAARASCETGENS